MIDPKALAPGTHVRYHLMPDQVLARRKDDDSGWWLEDGSGLTDRVWNDPDSGWSVVDKQ